MAQPLSEERKEQWKAIITEQRQSKLSIASWCRQKGVAVHAFYHWAGKLIPKTQFSRSTFIELIEEKNKSATGIVIEYQGFHIQLSEHFDPSTLRRCIEVLKKC